MLFHARAPLTVQTLFYSIKGHRSHLCCILSSFEQHGRHPCHCSYRTIDEPSIIQKGKLNRRVIIIFAFIRCSSVDFAIDPVTLKNIFRFIYLYIRQNTHTPIMLQIAINKYREIRSEKPWSRSCPLYAYRAGSWFYFAINFTIVQAVAQLYASESGRRNEWIWWNWAPLHHYNVQVFVIVPIFPTDDNYIDLERN